MRRKRLFEIPSSSAPWKLLCYSKRTTDRLTKSETPHVTHQAPSPLDTRLSRGIDLTAARLVQRLRCFDCSAFQKIVNFSSGRGRPRRRHRQFSSPFSIESDWRRFG